MSKPVLGPAGNKLKPLDLRKPIVKQISNDTTKPIKVQSHPIPLRKSLSSASRQTNLSLNASCSSDASTDSSSSNSRASTGRISQRSGTTSTHTFKRKMQCSLKGQSGDNVVVGLDGCVVKKRCGWVTSNTDPLYAAFHDEEWGLPVHDDKKLFELLSLSTALAELTWPVILSKRPTFRDVFLDFDPITVSKLNDKKIVTAGSTASSLLSEVKLRAIIENAREICKIIDEFGSFDKYIWGFVNYKPSVSNFRYPRQVPIKTSKAETISKDLVRRGFRGVGPTVIYSFMQVAGITNDHLISCFRYQDCIIAGDLRGKSEGINMSKNEETLSIDLMELELSRDIDDLSLSG